MAETWNVWRKACKVSYIFLLFCSEATKKVLQRAFFAAEQSLVFHLSCYRIPWNSRRVKKKRLETYAMPTSTNDYVNTTKRYIKSCLGEWTRNLVKGEIENVSYRGKSFLETPLTKVCSRCALEGNKNSFNFWKISYPRDVFNEKNTSTDFIKEGSSSLKMYDDKYFSRKTATSTRLILRQDKFLCTTLFLWERRKLFCFKLSHWNDEDENVVTMTNMRFIKGW